MVEGLQFFKPGTGIYNLTGVGHDNWKANKIQSAYIYYILNSNSAFYLKVIKGYLRVDHIFWTSAKKKFVGTSDALEKKILAKRKFFFSRCQE